MKQYLSCFLFLFFAISFSQQTDYIDFKRAEVKLDKFNLDEKWVGGKVNYTFDILKPVDSIYLDSKNIYGYIVFLNNQEVEYYVEKNKLWIINGFETSKNNQLRIEFNAMTKKAMYFVGWNNEARNQIWTQGQGKYTSNWLPSIDDMNDKIEFDISVSFNSDYEVIANGKLINKDVGEETTTWHFDMQQPMSSYLVALAIGKYNKQVEFSKSGIPLEMYYYSEDTAKFEPTYRYTKRMFDFLEQEIGVSYPWQDYKQVPVHDFLYAGMENTSLTIFADSFVVDSIGFVDRNYVNVNAHELAHQWFGDLVTETSGTHHWLHEGFATYYALLAEREVFGDDYYYWRLYEYAQQLLDQDKMGRSTSLLDPKSSSLTFYQKGAWVLHMLREKVGNKAFRAAVRNYLKKHQFKNVETDDFLTEMEKESGKNLEDFKQTWLISKTLPYETMEMHLYRVSTLIKGYLQVDCMNKDKCVDVFKSAANKHIKMKAIEQLKAKIPRDAFQSKNVKVRQAIAQNLPKIPLEYKEDYENLLNDASYATIELALFNLWNNFPTDQAKYLRKTKDVNGFNDKNVRILWLTLALITDDFEPENNDKYFNELEGYSSDNYSFEIRQNAFRSLAWIASCGDECQRNLQKATKHHNWRFSKFAKNLLKKIKSN